MWVMTWGKIPYIEMHIFFWDEYKWKVHIFLWDMEGVYNIEMIII